MSEPDYEAIMDDRAIERGEQAMHRLDMKYGRVEDGPGPPPWRHCGDIEPHLGHRWDAPEVQHGALIDGQRRLVTVTARCAGVPS